MFCLQRRQGTVPIHVIFDIDLRGYGVRRQNYIVCVECAQTYFSKEGFHWNTVGQKQCYSCRCQSDLVAMNVTHIPEDWYEVVVQLEYLCLRCEQSAFSNSSELFPILPMPPPVQGRAQIHRAYMGGCTNYSTRARRIVTRAHEEGVILRDMRKAQAARAAALH